MTRRDGDGLPDGSPAPRGAWTWRRPLAARLQRADRRRRGAEINRLLGGSISPGEEPRRAHGDLPESRRTRFASCSLLSVRLKRFRVPTEDNIRFVYVIFWGDLSSEVSQSWRRCVGECEPGFSVGVGCVLVEAEGLNACWVVDRLDAFQGERVWK